MKNEMLDFDLVLNHITAAESFGKDKKQFEEYKQIAFLWSNNTGKLLPETEILAKYNEGVTMEKLISQNPDQYIFSGRSKEIDGKKVKLWFDLWSTDIINVGDPMFDFFFICKLRGLDLLDMDEFLEYHLENSFSKDAKHYLRFLKLTVRKYFESHLNQKLVDTVNEWMAECQKNQEQPEGQTPITSKLKFKRTAEDALTALNQEQTALMIHILREGRIILKDEYCNNKEAGQAFYLLTKFSADNIRQTLGINELERISTKKNLTEISNVLIRLDNLIGKKLKDKK